MNARGVTATVGAIISTLLVLSGCAAKPDVLKIENLTDPLVAEGAEATGVTYWLPSSTDFSSMPNGDIGDVDHCSAAMTSWLGEHADRLTFPQKVRFTNISKDPQVVTLTTNGTRPGADSGDDQPTVGVKFQCGPPSLTGTVGDGELEWHDIIYNVTKDENKDLTAGDQQSAFSMTLAPGGTVGAIIMLTGGQPFDGRLQASSSAADVTNQTISILSGAAPQESFTWPGMNPAAAVLVYVDHGALYCRVGQSNTDRGQACSPDQITTLTNQLIAMRSEQDVPPFLKSKWCTKSGDECFDLAEERKEHPNLFISWNGNVSETEVTGVGICLEDDLTQIRNGVVDRDCSESMRVSIEYYPVGVGWNCSDASSRGWDDLTKCVPDYTNDHDLTKDRIVIRPNHQQDAVYHDMPPMYRVDQ